VVLIYREIMCLNTRLMFNRVRVKELLECNHHQMDLKVMIKALADKFKLPVNTLVIVIIIIIFRLSWVEASCIV